MRDLSWADLSFESAQQIQRELAPQVILEDRFLEPHYVAGIDVGFREQGRKTHAAIVVLEFPSLHPVDQSTSTVKTTFPYVPGYLSFRELPAVLKASAKLHIEPDLYLCDGQGIAHPRRFGIASHLGVLLDKPTIGVAKSRLIGTYREPGLHKGNFSLLKDKGEVIGVVLRTRTNVKPLFVSPGHRISIKTAMHYTLACTTRYRLPETTRLADRLASG